MSAAPAAVVGGRVVNGDGEPLESVEIVAAVKQDRSNPANMMRMMRLLFSNKKARFTRQGGFRVSSLPAGETFELKLEGEGYAAQTLTVETLRHSEVPEGTWKLVVKIPATARWRDGSTSMCRLPRSLKSAGCG